MASAPVAPAPSVRSVRRRGFAALARAYPLGAFVAVTFASPGSARSSRFACSTSRRGRRDPRAFGPAIGAYVVLRADEGRAGVRAWLRRLTLWRVDPKLYVFAVVALPALIIAGYAFLPDGYDKLGDAGAAFPVSFLGMLIVLALLGGGQEEPGWRGLPCRGCSERYSPLGASVRLGVIWALWHLPLFVLVADYDNGDSTWPASRPCSSSSQSD